MQNSDTTNQDNLIVKLDQDKEVDYKTRKIAEFNKNLANESSLKSIIIPIRDGISIAVKL